MIVDGKKKFVEAVSERISILDHKSNVTLDGEEALIVLTGHRSDKVEKKAGKLGTFENLQKLVDIETLIKKIKKVYKQKFESSMMAATFAEAGEFDTAKDILEADEENGEKENDKKSI